MHTKIAANRRERPSKPALTRVGVVEAALTILQNDGLEKVTMRSVASALDTGAASLYVYVSNTADLHSAMLDALIARVVTTPRRGTWRDALKALLKRYLELLGAYPNIATMALSMIPNGPNYLSLVDAILGLLQKGGVGEDEAAWGVDLLLLYVTAQAAEKSAWNAGNDRAANIARLASAIGAADERLHPNVTRLGTKLLSGTFDRFNWHLDVIMNGLAGTPALKRRKAHHS